MGANKETSIGVKVTADLRDYLDGLKTARESLKKFGNTIDNDATTPIKAFQNALFALKNAQKKAINPEEYAKIGDEIKRVQSDLDKFKGKTSQSTGLIDQMIGSAKGLLPAFGFAALAAGGVMAFKQITAATSATADEWEFTITGLKTGVNQFWQTLATGDWSNFTDRMREAIEAGYDYASMMDTIQDQTRALSMLESDAADKSMDLEIKMRNKLLSKEERIKAGKERIALEETLVKERKLIAEENYNNEVNEAKRQTRMSEEQLVQIAKDINSEKRMRADAYTEKIKQYEKLKNANTSTVMSPTTGASLTVKLPDTPQMKAMKAEIDATESFVKEYADLIKRYDILNDESQKKFVEGYVKKNEAAVSGKEHMKKIITQVNSLMAGVDEYGQKLEDKTNSISSQIQAYNKELDSSKNLTIDEIQAIKTKVKSLEDLKKVYESIASDPASFRTDKLSTLETGRVSGKLQVSTGEKSQFDSPELATKKRELGIKVNTQGLENIGKYLDQNDEKTKKFREELLQLDETQSAVVNSVSGGFETMAGSMVDSLGLAENGFQGFLKGILQTVTKLIAMALAQSISNAIVGATASGAATGPGAIFTTPAFIATAIGGVMAAFAAIPKFNNGGVVTGASFFGDKNIVRVNSGEEILKRSDPRHRYNQGTGTPGQAEILPADVKLMDDHILISYTRALARRRART